MDNRCDSIRVFKKTEFNSGIRQGLKKHIDYIRTFIKRVIKEKYIKNKQLLKTLHFFRSFKQLQEPTEQG